MILTDTELYVIAETNESELQYFVDGKLYSSREEAEQDRLLVRDKYEVNGGFSVYTLEEFMEKYIEVWYEEGQYSRSRNTLFDGN